MRYHLTPEKSMTTVLVIDDHDIVRFGLQALIESRGNYLVIGSKPSLASGLTEIARVKPDLLICDMSLEDSRGLDTVRAVVAAQGARPVLMLSMHDEMMYAEQTIALGGRGFLMKERAQEFLLPAMDTILAGNVWVSAQVNSYLLNRLLKRQNGAKSHASPASRVARLSQRELEVLEKMSMGRTTKEIAFEFGLSSRTVDIHRANIKKKLELKSSAEMVAFALARF